MFIAIENSQGTLLLSTDIKNSYKKKIMFHKIHFRLTCLCSVSTIFILCLFTVFYLSLSEKTLTENYFLSLQHDIDTMCTSLEQQTVITFQYLNTLEQNGNYLIFLWDNGIPFYFNQIEPHLPYQKLSQTALSKYQEIIAEGTNSSYQQFILTDSTGTLYDIYGTELFFGQSSAAENLQKRNSMQSVTLLVLASRSNFQKQLLRQRFLFFLLSLLGCIFLTFFSWYFTKKLLHPIQESQQKQIQFISDASHELRTPLAVIQSCISIQPPHYEKTIQQECLRMGHLIEDMLTLTGLQNQTLTFHPKECEADTLLLDTYESIEPLALEKNLSLHIQLPDATIPHIFADSEKIRQLLLILLQNAISYTPSGGKITLKLSVSVSKGVLIFQVIDTGIGISDNDKEKIFQRFYRAESSHTAKEHFGLGLCIAKEIALAHHGSLQVSDTLGGGSTFTCILPIKAT